MKEFKFARFLMKKILLSSCCLAYITLLNPNILEAKEYSIVLGTYKNKSYAKEKMYQFANHDAKIVKDKKYYIVIIDHLSSKQEAKEMLREVKLEARDAFLTTKEYQPQDISNRQSGITLVKVKPNQTVLEVVSIQKDDSSKSSQDTIQTQGQAISDLVETDSIKTDTNGSNLKRGISLKDAILLSLNNSYKIQSAKERVNQAKEKVEEKLAAYMPRVDLYLNGGGSYLKPYQAKEVKFLKSDESLVITQNIYAGDKHENDVKKERANLKMAIDKYRDKVEEETLKIIEAYLSLIYQKEAIDKARENMTNLQKILDIVKIKEESGAASKGDLNYIKSQVENAKSALVKVESKYKNAISYYEYFVGKLDESKMPIESEFDFELGDLNSTLATTFKQNAKLCVAKSKLKASKYNLHSLRSKYRPKLDLTITTKDKQSGYEAEPQEDRATAMLQLSYNLYNGGKDSAILNGAKSKVRELQYNLADIKRGVKHNTEQLYENVTSTKETLMHTEDEVRSNKKVIDSYWNAFKYGTQDLQALLQAQRSLNRSQLDEIKQKQNYLNSYFKLLQQTGDLLDTLGINSL